jgi:hypothetical protein
MSAEGKLIWSRQLKIFSLLAAEMGCGDSVDSGGLI